MKNSKDGIKFEMTEDELLEIVRKLCIDYPDFSVKVFNILLTLYAGELEGDEKNMPFLEAIKNGILGEKNPKKAN